ncbi:unnamed protein product [Ostreobium quekettii]|uniref:Purple acid phosphatase n=1 Tax=Ostreobium quekettii TaxID=121088 RepID=A0A8S1IVK9_9CHLO|nr:unnamed protein product [Ostreobium quekettii]
MPPMAPPTLALLSLWAVLAACSAQDDPIGALTPSDLEAARQTPQGVFNVSAVTWNPYRDAVMDVNVTGPVASGDWIRVSFSGIPFPDPHGKDWVALYVPGDADPAEVSPVKYRNAKHAEGYMDTGAGSLDFILENHRDTMRFYFMRKAPGEPFVAAKSPLIQLANPNAPMQVHLALTANHSEMKIQWVTKDTGSPAVEWGTSPGHYTSRSKATSTTYTRDDMCGPPANTTGFIDPGVFHAATVTGVKPLEQIYYRVGDEVSGYGPEHSFIAPPLPAASSSVIFAVLGDMGQSEVDKSNEPYQLDASLETSSRLEADDDLQLVLHIGDLGYACGYVAQWDRFYAQLQPIISRVPYMTCPGNHERDYPNSGDRWGSSHSSGGECGVAYARRQQMPRPGDDKMWYSFDFGPIHFS